MDENDEMKSLESGDGIQRYGSLRNKIAKEYDVDRMCVHIILDGKRMFDSDKMKQNHKVKIEFSQPAVADSEMYSKSTKHKQHWKGDPIEVSDALETDLIGQPSPGERGVSSLEDVQLQSTINEHSQANKEISEFLIPPLFKDINQLSLSEDIDDVSLTSGVGRVPNTENGNSEEFFVITQNDGTLKSESETELRFRKMVEELSKTCEQLRKHNFLLQLYDARIRSRPVELREIVSRNFQRLKLNPDTMNNVLSSDLINENAPEKSLHFRSRVLSECSEVSASFRDTLDSLARITKKWAKDDNKILQILEDDLEEVRRKHKEAKSSVKYWKDKSKDTEDRLKGVEKQRDDIKKNLELSVSSIEDEMKKVNRINEQLEKRLETQKTAVSRLTKENNKLKKQIVSLNTNFDVLEGERRKDQVSIERNMESTREKTKRLKLVEGEKKMLDNEVADLLAEKSELTRTAQLQWDENELLKHKIRELQERMYDDSCVQKNSEVSKHLQLASPVHCLILLFFAWDEMIGVLTSFWGVCIILPLGGGLFWLNYIDFLRLGRFQLYMNSLDKLIVKAFRRLCKRRKFLQREI